MPVVSSTTLKTYFETGDRPSQANFEDLIDTSLQSTTVFGRSGGPIVAVTADYTTSQIADTATKVMMTALERTTLAGLSAAVLSPSGGDDTTTVQAALTALGTSGGTLTFSPGTYVLSAALTVTTAKAITITADTTFGAVILLWSNSSGGLSITYTTSKLAPTVSNLFFRTSYAGGGTGLTITAPVAASFTTIGALVENVCISGDSTPSEYWLKCLHLENCWYPVVRRFSAKGHDATVTFLCLTGIEHKNCQVLLLHDFTIIHCGTAILQSGSTGGEGFIIRHGEIVGADYGMIMTSVSDLSGTAIHDMHINTNYRGIQITNRSCIAIHDCLFYKTQFSTLAYQAVELVACRLMKVHNNTISGTGASGGIIGVTISGATSTYNVIRDNTFSNMEAATAYAILVTTSADHNYIYNNIAVDNTTQCVLVGGAATATRLANNEPLPTVPVFGNGDTTPSVGNAHFERFDATNTGATTITAFDDGIEGQHLIILFNNGNTTLQHNAGLILRGAVNVTPAAGKVMTFERSASLWLELSRTF